MPAHLGKRQRLFFFFFLPLREKRSICIVLKSSSLKQDRLEIEIVHKHGIRKPENVLSKRLFLKPKYAQETWLFYFFPQCKDPYCPSTKTYLDGIPITVGLLQIYKNLTKIPSYSRQHLPVEKPFSRLRFQGHMVIFCHLSGPLTCILRK